MVLSSRCSGLPGLRLWNLVSLVRVATAGSKMHGLSIPAVSSPRVDFPVCLFGLGRGINVSIVIHKMMFIQLYKNS